MIATRPLRAALLAAALLLVPAASAAAAPTHYVTMTDGASIAINVKVPPQCTATNPCPTFFEMSGYESGSDDGKTPLGDLADQTGLAAADADRHARRPRRARRRPLRHRARQPARHRLLVRRVRPLQLALGARRPRGDRQLDRAAAVVERRRRDLRPLLQRPHRHDGRRPRGRSTCARSARPACSATSTATSSTPAASPTTASRCCGPAPCGPSTTSAAAPPAACIPPESTSAQCAANQAGRSRTVLEDPLIHGLDDTDSEWYRTRSLVNSSSASRCRSTSRPPTRTSRPAAAARPTSSTTWPPGSPSASCSSTASTARRPRSTCSRTASRGWTTGCLQPRADLGLQTGDADLAAVFGPRDVPTTTSRVILGYQGEGKAVGEIALGRLPARPDAVHRRLRRAPAGS